MSIVKSKSIISMLVLFLVACLTAVSITEGRVRIERRLGLKTTPSANTHEDTSSWTFGINTDLNFHFGIKSIWWNNLNNTYQESVDKGVKTYPTDDVNFMTKYQYYISRLFFSYLQIDMQTSAREEDDEAGTIYRQFFTKTIIGVERKLSRYTSISAGLTRKMTQNVFKERFGTAMEPSPADNWLRLAFNFSRPFGRYRSRTRFNNFFVAEFKSGGESYTEITNTTAVNYKFTQRLSLNGSVELNAGTGGKVHHKSRMELEYNIAR